MRQPKFRMRQPNAPTELAKSKPGVPGAGLELQARGDTSTFDKSMDQLFANRARFLSGGRALTGRDEK
jgi:hypothetical protein